MMTVDLAVAERRDPVRFGGRFLLAEEHLRYPALPTSKHFDDSEVPQSIQSQSHYEDRCLLIILCFRRLLNDSDAFVVIDSKP